MSEINIVWVRNPAHYEYLREGSHGTTKRRGKIGVPNEWLLVGYAEHSKEGLGVQAYMRRFWYLKQHDRDRDPDGVYATRSPAEAVYPVSVAVGRASAVYP